MPRPLALAIMRHRSPEAETSWSVNTSGRAWMRLSEPDGLTLQSALL